MGDGDVGHACGVQVVHPGLDRAVQTPTRLPHHQRTMLAGPVGDIVVITHHGDRQRAGGRQHLGCHRTGECRAFGTGQGPVESALRLVEGLDGHEDGPRSHAEIRAGLVHSGVGHEASVGTRRFYATGGVNT